MQFDVIFFDVGNTLYFFDYDFLCGLLSDRFDISANGAELAEAHRRAQLSVIGEGLEGLGHDELWRRTYSRWFTYAGIQEDKVGPVMEAIRSHPFRHLFWAKTDDGTREMLDWFRERGARLGVISNAEGQIRRLLEHTGLDNRFETIIDSSEVGIAKPDSRIFELAMERMGVAPERCIHVGDVPEIDVAGAKAVGITPILIDREGLNPDCGCIRLAKAVDLPGLEIFK